MLLTAGDVIREIPVPQNTDLDAGGSSIRCTLAYSSAGYQLEGELLLS